MPLGGSRKIRWDLTLKGAHHLLAYADEVNLLQDNVDTLNKNRETLIDASKEVGLDINIDKTGYVSASSPECRSRPGHINSK
jgi:hypothetical protein